MAVGWEAAPNSDGTPAVWTSTDGANWLRSSTGPRLQRPETILAAVTAGGPGLVAVGTTHTDDENMAATVRTSTNGIDWELVPQDSNVFTPGSTMAAITAGGPGLVAVGGVEAPYPDGSSVQLGAEPGSIVWTSQDGTRWSTSPADADVLGSDSRLVGVTTDGATMILVGSVVEAMLRSLPRAPNVS